MYSCKTELFEIELTICIKIDLALNNLQRLICHKTQLTNHLSSLEESYTGKNIGRKIYRNNILFPKAISNRFILSNMTDLENCRDLHKNTQK